MCKTLPWAPVLLGLALALPAHGQPLQATQQQAAVAVTAVVTPRDVAQHHATLVHATYSDTLNAALVMRTAVRAFTAQPDPARLEAARQAWLAAREFYGQTEAFRFYGGPIDAADGLEGRLNAWPMDEAYVDAVEGQKTSGLVNRRQQPLSKKALIALNERGGEENIATGWHAIEFMLWGQDLSDTGPGQRRFQDFVDGQAPNADRRRQYLNAVTDLLVDDLGTLVRAWAPGVQHNYRARFENGGSASLRKIFVGLGSLSRGELAGERLEVALASQDQEDEHSCFSDNTHRDAVANAQGIENVWLGRYVRADGSTLEGPGLRALVATKDQALATQLTQQVRNSVQAAESIPAPFDRAIAKGHPGRPHIEATIRSLTAQSDLLVSAAAAIGIQKLTLVQP